MQKSLCPPIRRALISVSDKTNLVEFAKALAALDIEILSTGGTARLLTENQIRVIEVADYTGFPEIMDGRVKTLHPKIHGGLLGRRGLDDKLMAEQQIAPIDLLVVNLYPFQQVISNPDCDFANAIENIDIGGPTLLRAAAKNHAAVTVVVDSNDYDAVLNEIKTNEQTVSDAMRFHLAKKAFAHTAQYDGAIANYLGTLNEDFQPIDFPDTYSCQFIKKQDLRYGENPHQAAAFYTNRQADPASVAAATQLQGKALSYNNIADTDAALECVKEFTDHACTIVKHANPCGVALANTQLAAYLRAFATDPTSSFGGIIAFNHPLEAETADAIIKKQFVEVIIAPGISEAAEQILTNKPNVRVLSCEPWDKNNKPRFDYKRVNGGLLIQEYDSVSLIPEELQTVTKRQPNEQELVDLFFAWNVAKHVKSNAIVYAAQQATVGIGAGQMSRVYSARIAGIKAQDENLEVSGSVMASDAFFPFRDGIDAAAKAGITAVIQPGGSIRDEEVIQAANEANIAMLFTGIRHFRH